MFDILWTRHRVIKGF